jgi:nitronate monooxygenase
MFESKYPIIALGMNQVSNLTLALAVAEAGAIPTISALNYLSLSQNPTLDIEQLIKDIDTYNGYRNKCDFIFSIDDRTLISNNKLLNALVDCNAQYLELLIDIRSVQEYYNELKIIIDTLKNNNAKLLVKIVSLDYINSNNKWTKFINNTFDGIIIKGPNGAGRVVGDSDIDIKKLLQESINKFPDKFIVPSGGIGTANEVKDLLDCGAGAVGIGTLFAASKESPLSMTAKEKLVNSNFQDLKKLKTYDYDQNALVFSEMTQNKTNNTLGLFKGVTTGTQGHVFAGKSIDNINGIRSVKEIIDDLCSSL